MDFIKFLRLLKLCKFRTSANYKNVPAIYKIHYYTLLIELTKDTIASAWFNEYKKYLLVILKLENNVNTNYSVFNKEYTKNKNLFVDFTEVRNCNVYSAILEAGFILLLKDDFDINNWLKTIGIKLELKDNLILWFVQYFEIIKNNKYHKLKQHCKQSCIPRLSQCVKLMNKTIFEILKLESLSIKNISVISTMSSGKSTFINALIGNEILPETQAACTAKITSIYDNDKFNSVSGFVLNNNSVKQLNFKINKNIAKEWNNDNRIERIIYEGDLKKIPNSNQIVAVHDTPGTNFSSNLEHQKITIDFLNNTKLDTIICLINAMYIGTNDSKEIIKKVYEISNNKNTQVIFVLNKIDTFDTKKESLQDAIKKTKLFVEHIGFHKPIVIPTSAKAAKMFRMALEKHSKYFTEDEEDDFRLFFRKFSKNHNVKSSHNAKIKIGVQEYSKNSIRMALKNTNFYKIEQIIKYKEIK